MAMNPQNVLSQLRMMSDPQLQQYAAMHKDDPFIFPLAFQESQTRKQMRSESQAMQPPQPKVTEQALAEMAPQQPMPENVGIGQLPADNLKGMAGGGIVAFDEGGEVPRYSGTTDAGSLVRSTSGGKSWFLDVPDTIRDPSVPYYRQIPNPFRPLAGQTFNSRQEAIDAYNAMAGVKTTAPRAGAVSIAQQDPFAYTPPVTTTGAPPGTPPGNPPKPTPADDTGAQLRPGGGQGFGFRPGEGLGLGTRPGTYMSELESMQPPGEVRSPFESQIRAAGLAETKAAQEYKDLREQQIKDAGLAGVDQERRLKAREEKLSKTEGDVAGMAILKAGLAIMSGSSPFALQNIGSGAQVGVEDYAKGREKIDAARERLDDAFDRLDQVRRGELMMNQKEQAQLQRDVSKTIAQTEKDVLAGAREAYGWKKEDTRAAFNAYVADRRMGAEITSRERLGIADINARLQAARTTADAPLNLYRQLGAAAPDSALRKGFDLTQQMRNSGLYGLLGKYADPMELEQLRTTNPEMYAMVVAQMQSALSKGLGATTPPPNAPILPAKQ